MELEQQKIAEQLQVILKDEGYPCHIENDGDYRINGMKIKKMKIVPDRQLSDEEQKDFDKAKATYAKDLGKYRKKELKEEKRKLKGK